MNATLRIEIFPADLDRCVEFYRALGFELVQRTDDERPYASMRLGEVLIGAAQTEPVDPARRAYPACTEVVIEVADVAALHERYVAAGIPISEALAERPWGLTDFRLHDPDGYYYRFTSR